MSSSSSSSSSSSTSSRAIIANPDDDDSDDATIDIVVQVADDDCDDNGDGALTYPIALSPLECASFDALTLAVADTVEVPPDAFYLTFRSQASKTPMRLNKRSRLPHLLLRDNVREFALVKRKTEPTGKPSALAALFPKNVNLEIVDGQSSVNRRIQVTEEDCSCRRFVERCAREFDLGDPARLRFKVFDPANLQFFIMNSDSMRDEILRDYGFRLELAAANHREEADAGGGKLAADKENGEPLRDVQSDEETDGGSDVPLASWKDAVLDKWICRSGKGVHDFFLSHRQASESQFVEKIFYRLQNSENTSFHSFWDRLCIDRGERWMSQFVTGLCQSKVAVLFCSEAALAKVRSANMVPDNLLLEWELALELLNGSEPMVHIFVVFVGKEEVMQSVSSSRVQLVFREFSDFSVDDFPDQYHCHSLSPKRLTVREVVKAVFELQGAVGDPRPAKSDELVTQLSKFRNKIDAKMRLQGQSQSKLSEIRAWLNPIDGEMRLQRQKHLSDHVPGTRQWLLDRLAADLFSKEKPDERVVWLQGNAGIGKSVMAALVARYYEKQNQLAAMFFCKHDDDQRRDARRLVLTLAYFLAEWNEAFLAQLALVLKTFPQITQKSMDEMFATLISDPLKSLEGQFGGTIVIVVDALDECEEAGSREDILAIFSQHCRALPAFVKIFITSRPEPDISDAFKDLVHTWIEPDAEDNKKDLAIYARSFLESHGAEPEAVADGPAILVDQSEGIFVWIVLACQALVSNDSTAITMDTIREVLSSSKADGDTKMDHMFFSTLNRIFGREDETNSLLFRVLGAIVIGLEPLSAAEWSSIFDESEESVSICVRRLRSIFSIDAATGKIRMFHKSLADYLTVRGRCTDERFAIGLTRQKELSSFLATRLMNLMLRDLRLNVCGLDVASLFQQPLIERGISDLIPGDLRYACLHFPTHLKAAAFEEGNPDVRANIEEFAEKHILHWMEFLALCRRFDAFFDLLQSLGASYLDLLDPVQRTSTKSHSFVTRTLFSDAHRLGLMFRTAITENPFQVYFSAVPAVPPSSVLYAAYFDSVKDEVAQHFPADLLYPTYVAGVSSQWSNCLAILEGHRQAVTSVAFSPDGRTVASGSSEMVVRIWDTFNGREKKVIRCEKPVWALAFSHAGDVLACSVTGGRVLIWDTTTWRTVQSMKGSADAVTALCFSGDDAKLVTGSEGAELRLWNPRNGKELAAADGHIGTVFDSCFSPDGTLVVSGARDKHVSVWNLKTSDIQFLKGHTAAVTAVAFSPDGDFFVSGSRDRTIRFWNTQTGNQFRTIDEHPDFISALTFTPNGLHLVTGSRDKYIRVINVANGRVQARFQGHTDDVSRVAVSSDSKWIASASLDKTIRLWNATQLEHASHRGHTDIITALTFSSDQQLVATASWDGTARVWSAVNGHEMAVFSGHEDFVNAVAFSRDGAMLATGSDDKTVRIWDVPTGLVLFVCEGHSDNVRSVAFSPDGTRLASGSEDRTARVWDAFTGVQLLSVSAHRNAVRAVAYSADGRYLASGSSDHALRIFDAQNGALLKEYLTRESITSVGFSTNGLFAWSLDLNSRRTMWPLDEYSTPSASSRDEGGSGGDARMAVDRAGWVYVEKKPGQGVVKHFWLPPELRGKVATSEYLMAVGEKGGNIGIVDVRR